MTFMRKPIVEGPRPDELRSLKQLLAQLAEVNQRLARSHVLLEDVAQPCDDQDDLAKSAAESPVAEDITSSPQLGTRDIKRPI